MAQRVKNPPVMQQILGSGRPPEKRMVNCCWVTHMVKYLPAMQETRLQSLGQEDPLGKEMATRLVYLPEEFHGQKSLVGYSPWHHKVSNMME